MEVTMLRDKLNTGMRARLDNLSTMEYVLIEMLIQRALKDQEEFLKNGKLDDETDKTLIQSTIENIEIYKSMLAAIKNEKTVQVDCYRSDVEQESFATMIKKYKKIKE